MSKKLIYQLEREEKDEYIEVLEYSINEKQESNLTKHKLPYRILIKKADFDKLKIKSDNITILDKKLKNKEGENIVEINVKSKELYDYVLKQAKEEGFTKYEEDLNAEHRYLIDNDIPMGDFLPLKYISVDIETIGDVNDQDIVLISAYGPFKDEIRKVYLDSSKVDAKVLKELKSTKFDGFELDVLGSEKELLEKFKQDIIDFAPQVIIGWNVIDFDFKVIKDKMAKHKIPFSFSKFEGETRLRIYNDFFRSSTMTAPGLIVFDVINLLRMNFIMFDEYKLDYVAGQVLGDSKIALENDENAADSISEKINAIEYMFKNDLKKLIDYNFKDSLLTSQILEKLNLLALTTERSIVTGTHLSKVRSPIASLDIMYLKELHKRNLVADSNFNYSDITPIEGAFVLTPKMGFYKDIFVLDFKSLYPSMMMTFNIDPFTYSKKGPIKAPNGAHFNKDPGILPEIILEIYKERDVAKKAKDDIKSYALKITMNSFYGAVASPKCRFYNKDVGEAITSFGRFIIQKGISKIEEDGDKVIYSDTDSLFVKTKKEFKNLDEKLAFGKKMEADLNEYFEEWVSKEFKQKSYLSIEMEKIFSHFFIATKKRYVGHDELSKKTMYTGMEAIRGDWTELAQNFQREIVDIIFSDKPNDDIIKFVLDYVDNLKKGRFDDLLVYKKKITKPLAEYTKTTPPHVRAARELENFSGRLVKYVMTKEGPKHIKLIKANNVVYDYDHYVDKQLKGVSDDLLDSLGIDFDSILEGKKQKSLDNFF